MTDVSVDSAISALHRIDTHEQVCAQRYAELHSTVSGLGQRLSRLETLQIAASGAIITFLAGLIVTLVLK